MIKEKILITSLRGKYYNVFNTLKFREQKLENTNIKNRKYEVKKFKYH